MNSVTGSKNKKIIIICIIGLIILILIGIGFFIGSKSSKTTIKKRHKQTFTQPVKVRVESDDWTSGEYQFNGLYLTLGEPYIMLSANSWTVNWKELGYADVPTLNPGDTLEDLKMTHDIFTNANIHVSLMNNTDKKIKASDATVYGIEVVNEPYVGFALPGNYFDGTTKKEIVSSYGAPTKTEKISDEEEAVTYEKDGKYYLKLVFKHNEGLYAFKYIVK